jgi:hypothetical protein
MRPDTYDMYRAYTPDHVPSPPFWDYLSDAGHRCAVLDIPHSGVSKRLNGVPLAARRARQNATDPVRNGQGKAVPVT